MKENGFIQEKGRSKRYHAENITGTDYADDNADKTEYIWFNQTGDISTLAKAWSAIDRQSAISDRSDKMKRNFFQAVVVSIVLYGCTNWMLTKRMEKKLDGNCTRMLRAILNKYLKQHPSEQQLYSSLPPISKTIYIRRTRHTGHCWGSKGET